jgi:hypothetical protein
MVSEMINKKSLLLPGKKIKEPMNQTWAKINLQPLQAFA